MEKLLKPVYSRSQNFSRKIEGSIVTDYELKYNEAHEVIKVDIGERDLAKEVVSHVDEVGLLNVIKQAIAHGENPYNAFKKDEPGLMFAVDPNATMDEIIEAANLNKTKLSEFAATLGVSVDDLVKALNDGNLETVVAAHAQKEKEEGDE